MQPIQMELSGKQKNFCKFFSTFLKSHLNFEHFEKSDDSHRLLVRSMSKKSRSRLPFGKQHGKQVPTLLKSERQDLYHIY